MKLKAYGLETIQKLDDENHDIEGVFDLPLRRDGKEQSLVVRLSKAFGKTYLTITHEIDGDHFEVGDMKITKELFEQAESI